MRRALVVAAALAAPLLAVRGAAFAASPYRETERGNALYEQREFAEARDRYMNAQADRPDARELDFNIAGTFYEEGDAQRAIASLAKVAADTAVAAPLRASASYNLGNALYRTNALDRAVDAYRQALRLDPADLDAKHNLELAMKKKQEQESEKEQDKEQRDQQGQGDTKNESKSESKPDSSRSQGAGQEDNEKTDQMNEGKEEGREERHDGEPNRQQERAGGGEAPQAQPPDSLREGREGEPEGAAGISRADALRILQALEAQEIEQAREEERRALLRAMRSAEARDW